MRQNKIVIIMFVLLVFVSQTLASVAGPMTHHSMPFSSAVFTSSVGHKASLENRSVGKSTHQHLQTLLVTNTLDCCKDTHPCPMSFCMSMAAIMDHQWIHHGSQLSQGITNLIQQERPPRGSSLYRPPIFA
jgi:hypothetical protein